MRKLLAIALIALPLAPGGGSGPGRSVVATSADESSPSAGPSWIAWTRGSTPAPVIVLKLGTVELRDATGGRTRRVTPPGVLAAAGGGDARTLAIQEVRGGASDLKLVDVATGRLRDPPRGVNTRQWEWRGDVFGRWLLLGRIDFGRSEYRVVLHDLASGRERTLADVSGHGAYAEPGQLNGRYAVWAACPDNACTLYRLRLGDRRPLRVPAPLYGAAAYAPSVTRTGVVYYAQGLLGCGRQVRIMRFAPGRSPRAIAALPPGYDLRFTWADGRRILYDRVRCATGRSDVYAVSPPSTVMAAPVR